MEKSESTTIDLQIPRTEEERIAYDGDNLIELARIKFPNQPLTVEMVMSCRKYQNIEDKYLREYIKEKLKATSTISALSQELATQATEIAEVVAEAIKLIASSPEAQAKLYLFQLKPRFDSMPKLHPRVNWNDVVKTLSANPEAVRTLANLDTHGFKMNVFGIKNGEIIFRTAQLDVTKIAPQYRNIMFDKKAQTKYRHWKFNRNSETLATELGVELADDELYNQLRVDNGWLWLATDKATRSSGHAFVGDDFGVQENGVDSHSEDGSLCTMLRVKMA